MNCATEQGYVGEISDYIYCERCGAKIYADGSGSCGATRESRKREREQIDDYDYRQHSNYTDPELGRESGWSL